MGSRHSVYARRSAETYGGVSPNAYIPSVTVDLRVFFPPNRESHLVAITELDNAYEEARQQLVSLTESGR